MGDFKLIIEGIKLILIALLVVLFGALVLSISVAFINEIDIEVHNTNDILKENSTLNKDVNTKFDKFRLRVTVKYINGKDEVLIFSETNKFKTFIKKVGVTKENWQSFKKGKTYKLFNTQPNEIKSLNLKFVKK